MCRKKTISNWFVQYCQLLYSLHSSETKKSYATRRCRTQIRWRYDDKLCPLSDLTFSQLPGEFHGSPLSTFSLEQFWSYFRVALTLWNCWLRKSCTLLSTYLPFSLCLCFVFWLICCDIVFYCLLIMNLITVAYYSSLYTYLGSSG